jgi:hypothetical protein
MTVNGSVLVPLRRHLERSRKQVARKRVDTAYSPAGTETDADGYMWPSERMAR